MPGVFPGLLSCILENMTMINPLNAVFLRRYISSPRRVLTIDKYDEDCRISKVSGHLVTKIRESRFVGCFAFYAGVPDKELVRHKAEGFVIMTPQNEKWSNCIEDCFPDAKKVSRYAIKKDTKFDKDLLHILMDKLPEDCELKDIDENIYDMCLTDPVTRDFVSSFESKEKYLDIGKGVVVIKSGRS